MDRRKTRDILFYALQCAKSDRRALIDAYGNDDSEKVVQDALKDIKAFERLQQKTFGTSRSQMDVILDAMKPVSVFELRKLAEEQPETCQEV